MAAWGLEEETKEQLGALLGQQFTDPIEAQARYSKNVDNFNVSVSETSSISGNSRSYFPPFFQL